MKKILLFSLGLALSVIAPGQKVEFFKGIWQEANEQAALQSKYIFLDAYTEWCGWCKVLEKEMLTDPVVAPFINEHFIPVQVDFEDSVGSKLAMKFRVWGYPTTLVFNAHGQLIDKFSGYTYEHGNYLDFLKNAPGNSIRTSLYTKRIRV